MKSEMTYGKLYEIFAATVTAGVGLFFIVLAMMSDSSKPVEVTETTLWQATYLLFFFLCVVWTGSRTLYKLLHEKRS